MKEVLLHQHRCKRVPRHLMRKTIVPKESKNQSANKTVLALVTQLADIEAAAQLVAALVPLPDVATKWAIVLSYHDHQEQVTTALSSALPALPMLDPYGTDSFASLSQQDSMNLRALVQIVAQLLSDPPGPACVFQTELTYPYVVPTLIPAAPEVAVAVLTRAGLGASTLAAHPSRNRLLSLAKQTAPDYLRALLVSDPDRLSNAQPADLASAVPILGLRDSPSVIARWKTLITDHHPALGVEAWEALLRYDDGALIKLVDEEHIRIAVSHGTSKEPVSLVPLLTLAKKADDARSGGKKGKSAAVTPSLGELALRSFAQTVSGKIFLERVDQALDRCDKGAVSAHAFWMELARLVVEHPEDPLGVRSGKGTDLDGHPDEVSYLSSNTMAIYVIERFPKPSGAAQQVLIDWVEQHPIAFGHYTKTFAKRVGIAKKAPPIPYAESDLTGLPPAHQKAWQTAREKSWAKEIRLPSGLPDAALAALSAKLPAPLPEDVQSFYRLHNGAGNDECFRGCRLYDLESATARRTTLLSLSLRHPFPPEWLPLTDDGAGNHACVVLSGPKAGQVFDFDHETGAGRALAKSFAQFVEKATWG